MISNKIKFTKSSLRENQKTLAKINRFLPVIKIKKQMLMSCKHDMDLRLEDAENELETSIQVLKSLNVFRTSMGNTILENFLKYTAEFDKENIAGVSIYIPNKIIFNKLDFCRYTMPWGIEEAIDTAREFGEKFAMFRAIRDIRQKVFDEYRKMSIRSSLFENVIIPRCRSNIVKISTFLMDQTILSLGQAKNIKRKTQNIGKDS